MILTAKGEPMAYSSYINGASYVGGTDDRIYSIDARRQMCWGLSGDEVPEQVRLEHYCVRFVRACYSKCVGCPNAEKVRSLEEQKQKLEEQKSKEAAEKLARIEMAAKWKQRDLQRQEDALKKFSSHQQEAAPVAPALPPPSSPRDPDRFEERNACGLFSIHRRPVTPYVHRYVLRPVRKLERRRQAGWEPYNDGAGRRDGWDR